MLSASKLPLFFWAEAIATACYTQNRSIIILTHEKMTYHIFNDRKPSIKHLHIFGCTFYLTRDGENLDKMKEKGDPYILVGYSTQSKGYCIYNKRTRLIVESIHLRFDKIKEMSMTSVHNSSGLAPPRQMTSDHNSSKLGIHDHSNEFYALSWKPYQGDFLNLPDHRIHKDGNGDASFQLKSDSLPHAHAQSIKTFYKHQDSRIMKAQELKTKTSAQTLIYKIFLQRCQVYQGRLLASFQDDAKYEHVGQDTRSQGGKDDQDGRIKI
ncbi:retrovirus-related pol polyprotein from transposon TNT 1-94 [Tanacetum coccineum]